MKDQPNSAPLKKYFHEIFYDYSCSAAQEVINQRICSSCGMYFASIKEVTIHNKALHNARSANQSQQLPQQLPQLPQGVAARREGELLYALEFHELEWVNFDDVDVKGLD